MCSCLHAPTLFCPCGIYQSGTSTSLSPDDMLVVNLRWGGRCSRHGDASSVSKACSLAVSMLWQAPRRTQNHWNRRRRVVGKTSSDIHVAITWISVRFQGSVVARSEVSVSMSSFCCLSQADCSAVASQSCCYRGSPRRLH